MKGKSESLLVSGECSNNVHKMFGQCSLECSLDHRLQNVLFYSFGNRIGWCYVKKCFYNSRTDRCYIPKCFRFWSNLWPLVNSHVNNGNWELIPRSEIPEGLETVRSVWSMRRKRDLTTNKVKKYKARLNVHGGKQTYGVNYFETLCLLQSLRGHLRSAQARASSQVLPSHQTPLRVSPPFLRVHAQGTSEDFPHPLWRSTRRYPDETSAAEQLRQASHQVA